MADEEIPEKVDLNFLARQGKQILAELADVRTEQAAMREDMKAIRAEQGSSQNLPERAR